MIEDMSGTTRRRLLTGLACTGLAVGTGAWTLNSADAADNRSATIRHLTGGVSLKGWPALPEESRKALLQLLEGNRRFRSGHALHPDQSVRWVTGLAAGQHPFATVLGCIDSRVPVEIITDQGCGSLFVARSAGHVLDDAVVGSVEFGVEELHIPLLVVLDHESCGAITAAIAAIDSGKEADGRIQYLVEQLAPSVAASSHLRDATRRLDAAVRHNVHATVTHLMKTSKIIRKAVQAREIGVVAARYDLTDLALTPA